MTYQRMACSRSKELTKHQVHIEKKPNTLIRMSSNRMERRYYWWFAIGFVYLVGLQPSCTCQAPVGEPIQEAITQDATESMSESQPEPVMPDTTTGTITVAQVCELLSQQICEPAFRCCQERFIMPYKDKEECIQKQQEQCLQTTQKEAAAIKQGQMVIDPTLYAACQKALTDAGKACRLVSFQEQSSTCGVLFQDKAQADTACLSGLSGRHCANNKGVCFATPTGTPCRLFSKEGGACADAPCSPQQQCIPAGKDQPMRCIEGAKEGEYCTLHAHCLTGLGCVQNQCAPAGQPGQPCQQGSCVPGAACHPLTGNCVKPLKDGQPCEFSGHCQAGTVCEGLSSGASRLCQPPGRQGDLCQDADNCQPGLGCQKGQCQPAPKTGEACTKKTACEVGAECDGSLCKTLPKAGEPCLLQAERPCAEGLGCFSKDGNQVCMTKHKEGETCTDESQCQSGLGCQGDKCTALGGDGSPCLNNRLCASGFACHFQEGTCRPERKKDESCTLDLDCEPGLACIGTGANKTCQKAPGQGQVCVIRCQGSLVCRIGIKPGACVPEVCRGATPRA